MKPFQVLEVRPGGCGAVPAPQLDVVGWESVSEAKSGEGRLERFTLAADQIEGRSARSGEQGQLQLEFDAEVAHVSDGSGQPLAQLAFSRPGDAVHHPARAGATRLAMGRLGQSRLDEAGQGAIDQRSPHGQDLSNFGVGGQCLGDGKAVCRSFGEKAEHRIFGHRGLNGHGPMVGSDIVTM